MISTTVQSCDWLGEIPGQDAGTEAVLRIETALPAGQNNAFYMDVVDPRPQLGDPIIFEIHEGFLGSKHEVEWKGKRYRQHDYSFDWVGPLVEIQTRTISFVPDAPDHSILGELGLK